jgi:L-2-hydroxycarboxylate dehydrogenase (NAD+)
MINLKTRTVSLATLRQVMERLLRAVGCDQETAAALADVHLEADMRGVGVQGLNHLINSHIQEIQSGHERPGARPEVVEERAGWALIDGNGGPGPLAAMLAADLAAAKASETGCAAIGIRNSHDLYMAGLYAERMARQGAVGLVFSDDVIPVVHPPGGSEPLIGSNPMAMAVPTEAEPFVIDFAPCATLPTYVRYARRYGVALPEGRAVDARGRPTTDPHQVCDGAGYQGDSGAISPLTHKGYGLLLMIDFLSGALVGCDMGTDHVTKPGSRKGHFLIALDPAMFGAADTFRHAVSARLGALKDSRKAEGSPGIRSPGERGFAARRQALEDGTVLIDELCWQDTLKLAAELGVELPG